MAKSGNRSTRGWKALRNFADGSCGIYALLQAYLILQGVHPRTAERLFSEIKTAGISDLIRLCREATVQANEGSDPATFVVPTGAGGAASPASDRNDLATPGDWAAEILNVGGEHDSTRGWYDERAILLLARILGIQSGMQVVCKTSEGDGSWFQSVDFSGPVRAQVLLLWSGGCHYEVVVRSVSVIASDILVQISALINTLRRRFSCELFSLSVRCGYNCMIIFAIFAIFVHFVVLQRFRLDATAMYPAPSPRTREAIWWIRAMESSPWPP